MDVHLELFSERLKRLLAGEERKFPLNWGAAKELIQNLQTVIESISSSLRYYQIEMNKLLFDLVFEGEVIGSDLWDLLKEVNCFVSASEQAIETLIMSNMQQNVESFSKELSDTLLGLESRIVDIKQHMQQVQLQRDMEFRIWIAVMKLTQEFLLRRQEKLQDDAMEELLDQLIEGPPQLSIVAMLNSFGLDMTAFAAEAYNSHYVKSYFDCYAWVSFDFSSEGVLLDRMMCVVMPQSALNEIMHMDFEQKRNALHDYLRNKRYLIVLDDVLTNDGWDHQNGSRVLALFTTNNILRLCRMENGEMISLDSVPARPLRATYREWPFVLLYYGRVRLEILEYTPAFLIIVYIEELPLYLKLCCFYLSVFSECFEISTRQLYQLWMAEGLIPDNSEATAEEYLEQLISGGIVEVKRRRVGGTIKACYVPSFTWTTLVKNSNTCMKKCMLVEPPLPKTKQNM